MKVLLLGKNGQLGSDICKYLDFGERKTELVALTRNEVDVSDLEMLRDVLTGIDFDILFNCTSIHKTDEIEKNAALAFCVNAHAVKIMAEIANSKKAKFFHISTDYVFGGVKYTTPINEKVPPSPINVYGASKALGEHFAIASNKNSYIVRVASLFGVRGSSGKGGNFIETMVKLFEERDNVTVVNDQIMSPTFTADVAKALCNGIDHNIGPGIYHVVNSGKASWYELAHYVSSKISTDCRVLPCKSDEFKTLASRPEYSVLENSKIARFVGGIPNWTNAVDRYLSEKGHF